MNEREDFHDEAFPPAEDRWGVERFRHALYVGLAIVGVIFMWVWASDAKAHMAQTGWAYPAICCSAQDCSETPAGAVRETPDGYAVTLLPGQHPMVTKEPYSIVIPYDAKQIKDSPDGLYHICLSRQQRLLCFFAGSRMG